MSNTVSLPSLSNINPTLIMREASPVLVDLCCYALFKTSLSPKMSCTLSGLAGVGTLLIFGPPSRNGLIRTSLFYLVYKVSHYFLTRTAKPSAAKGTATPSASAHATPTAAQPKAAPAKPSAASTPKGTSAPAATTSTAPPRESAQPKAPLAKPSAASIPKGTSTPPAPASAHATPPAAAHESAQPKAAPAKASAAPTSKDTGTPPASAQEKPTAPAAPTLISTSAPSPTTIATKPASCEISSDLVASKYDDLLDKVTLRFEDSFNLASDCTPDKILEVIEVKEGFQQEKRESVIRQIWNSPKIAKESTQLVKEAGAEMLKLYYDLFVATQSITNKDERHKAMAQLLINDEHYSKRFYPSNTKTILHIYRFIRGLRYVIECPLLEHQQVKNSKTLLFHTRLTSADVLPFFQPNTPPYECREAYNKVIDVFTPLIPHLPPEFSRWLVKDEAGKPFVIIPPKK